MGAKTSAARVRTNEHSRDFACLIVSRRPGTMFTSVCEFHALSMTPAGCGNTLSTVVFTIIRYVEKYCCGPTIVCRAPARPGPAHSGAVLHYLRLISDVLAMSEDQRIKEANWSTCNYCQVEYLCPLICHTERSSSSSLPIGRTIYLPWHSNHQYHSSRPATASCLQCCGEFSLYTRFCRSTRVSHKIFHLLVHRQPRVSQISTRPFPAYSKDQGARCVTVQLRG